MFPVALKYIITQQEITKLNNITKLTNLTALNPWFLRENHVMHTLITVKNSKLTIFSIVIDRTIVDASLEQDS